MNEFTPFLNYEQSININQLNSLMCHKNTIQNQWLLDKWRIAVVEYRNMVFYVSVFLYGLFEIINSNIAHGIMNEINWIERQKTEKTIEIKVKELRTMKPMPSATSCHRQIKLSCHKQIRHQAILRRQWRTMKSNRGKNTHFRYIQLKCNWIFVEIKWYSNLEICWQHFTRWSITISVTRWYFHKWEQGRNW